MRGTDRLPDGHTKAPCQPGGKPVHGRAPVWCSWHPPHLVSPVSALEVECLGRAVVGAPGAMVGGLLPRPHMPSFPPSLSSWSWASSITARVGRCQMGRINFPEPPGGPPLPRPDSSTGRPLGASPFWLQVPGATGQECGRGPGCMSGPWALQAQPGRSWKEAGQLVSGLGCCLGPPEG